MSPRLPRVSGEEVIRVLQRAGFVPVSQRGSHRKLRHADGRLAIVPVHRELATGTFASILRQAGLSPDDFEALR